MVSQLGRSAVIDGGDVRGIITGEGIFGSGPDHSVQRYLVSWIQNGVLYEQWIDAGRLTGWRNAVETSRSSR